MKKAVIYARYSSDRQTEQSIEGQLRVCHEFAEKNELTIIEEYIDRAMTGTNDKRPAFQKMIADSIHHKFDYTKNSCNIKSKMLYYKWVMKDAKIQTNQNKIE